MAEDSPRKLVQRFIEWMHPQLADFAEESFEMQGRGAIRIGIPQIPPTPLPGPFSTSMKYETAEDLRRPPARDETMMTDKDRLLRLVDGYEPPRQAVVVFEFADAEPISGTIDLTTMIIDEA